MRIAHDYAQSLFSAQGLTSETCVVVTEPTFDRHDLYVGASRARGQTTLVIDRAAVDAHVRANRPVSRMRGDVTAEERRATLIASWSRKRVKSTTLEFSNVSERDGNVLNPVTPGPASQSRGRERTRGLDHVL
ncbi:MAG: hypothetical protein HC834_09210 [Rhodospirillales bacterium]|nr:hypothetical protein [Rhodospirillales bacterium]